MHFPGRRRARAKVATPLLARGRKKKQLMRRANAVVAAVALLVFLLTIAWLSSEQAHKEWTPSCAQQGTDNITLCTTQYNCMWCLDDGSCRNIDYCDSDDELDTLRCRDYTISDVTHEEWHHRCRRAERAAFADPILFAFVFTVVLCYLFCRLRERDAVASAAAGEVQRMRVEPSQQ